MLAKIQNKIREHLKITRDFIQNISTKQTWNVYSTEE